MNKCSHLYTVLALFCFSCTPATAEQQTHLRLIDRLDRPADGYCVDVHGTPGNLRTDLPLFAHNCKPRLTTDSAVAFTPGGSIEFSELGLCVTVAGVNSKALPGAALLLMKCGESTTFFESTALQQFVLHNDGKLELDRSGLCLTVGPRSGVTYSSRDSWRPLYVDDCDSVDLARSLWLFASP